MSITPRRALNLLALIADCEDILEADRVAREEQTEAGGNGEVQRPRRRAKQQSSALTPPDVT